MTEASSEHRYVCFLKVTRTELWKLCADTGAALLPLISSSPSVSELDRAILQSKIQPPLLREKETHIQVCLLKGDWGARAAAERRSC